MSDPRPLRILISRLSAIGDCVLTMPMLCAVREHFPKAHIAWVTQGGPATLLDGHGAIDELIVVSRRWMKSPTEILSLRNRLKNGRFDIAIDPQGLTKSSLLAWLSGAKRRIGFQKPRGRELSRILNCELVASTREHLLDAQLELLKPLGIENPNVRFDLPAMPETEHRVASMLDELHLDCNFVAINSGASWRSKLWSAERYGQVARCLGERYEVPSLACWGDSQELEWAEEIVAGSGGRAVLAPRTTLPELASILRRARMFVGSDTGPMHIAAAGGTPCVGLYGATRPEISGAFGPQHIHLQKRYEAGTGSQRRRANNDAMLEIDVASVVAACEQILLREPGWHCESRTSEPRNISSQASEQSMSSADRSSLGLCRH